MFGNTLMATLIGQQEMAGWISNEAEDVSGKTAAEIERVIYARVSNFDFLEKATGAERQEQWSVKVPKTDDNAAAGNIRVRKILNLRHAGSGAQYVLTSKLKIGQKGNSAETSEQSSADQFNVFKYLADSGMLKDRYVFPIENSDLVWEIDCFPKPGEMYFEWVKIDLEGWPAGKELPALPFTAAEIIDGDKDTQTDEVKEKISRLYTEVFLMKNTKPVIEGPETATQEKGQPEVSPDTGSTDDPEPKPDEENQDDAGKENQDNPAGNLGEVTKEEFSSAGQLLTVLVPIIGPLAIAVHAQRGGMMTGAEIKQHTKRKISTIDAQGHKTMKEDSTGSYVLSDLSDAKDFVNHLERDVKDMFGKIKHIDRIDMHLWPQKDGRYSSVNIRTDRDGETRVFTENNPGKLKWFSLSLAGKRSIRLDESTIDSFKFNNRTISCLFDGKTVEFDVAQLRSLRYQTKPKNNAFEIVEYNYDA